MSTFVGRLARTFSQGGNEVNHRRAVSTSEPVEVSPPHQLKHKLSSSPSFNDFSLRTEADAAEEFGWLVPSFSLDNSSIVGLDDKSTIGLMSVGSRVDPFQTIDKGSTQMVDAAATPASEPASPAGKMKRRTKIMGMDAYDYCDLIRTSSM